MIGKPPDLERIYPTQIIVSRLHVKLPPNMRCNRRLHCRIVHVSQWIQHFLVGGLRLYSFDKIVFILIIISIYFQVSFSRFPFYLICQTSCPKQYKGIQVFIHKFNEHIPLIQVTLSSFLSRSGSKLLGLINILNLVVKLFLTYCSSSNRVTTYRDMYSKIER